MSDTQDDGLCIPCPAKLNLTLAVGPPRDDGLHPIASVMLPLPFGLCDTLSIRRLDRGPSRFDRIVAPGCPRPMAIDWPLASDLAWRAHALLEQTVGKPLPIDCTLSKVIPTGAGLGGGSSNAAGMLVGLRALFDLQLSDDRLAELGQTLGADVGFAVRAVIDHQPAVVTGIGEVVTPLPSLPDIDLTLVFPDGACPTGEVYAAFDADDASGTSSDQLAQLAQRWLAFEQPPEPMNDLTAAATRVCPAIGVAIDTLGRLGHTAHLTGSGSALFVLAENASQAKTITQAARDAGLAACPARYQARPRPG